MQVTPREIYAFWFDEVGEPGWSGEDDRLDHAIRERFGPTWKVGKEGDLANWAGTPLGALALALLLDQFPRNMFRGTLRAFASDPQARAVAEAALERDWDLVVPEREQMFLYLPLGHSESLADQDRAYRLVEERMSELGRMYLPHVRAHREMIRRFGRFPTRNDALGRLSTPEEAAFLDSGGCYRLVEEMRSYCG